jgi:hypothetical protein
MVVWRALRRNPTPEASIFCFRSDNSFTTLANAPPARATPVAKASGACKTIAILSVNAPDAAAALAKSMLKQIFAGVQQSALQIAQRGGQDDSNNR